MIIYNERIDTFLDQCDKSGPMAASIGSIMTGKMVANGVTSFDKSQVAAWANSLPAIGKVLKQSGIDRSIKVAVEYKIRNRGDRVDFLIYGLNGDNDQSLVIIELKQWSSVQPSGLPNYVLTNGGGGIIDDHQHPSYQARRYKSALEDFNKYIQENGVTVKACSFLHNMNNSYHQLLDDIKVYPFIDECPAFLEDDIRKLGDFISRYVRRPCTPHNDFLYEIDRSEIVPSRQFANMVATCLQGNSLFSLDDGQSHAVSKIVQTVTDAIYYNEKKVIIIKGGPGTGKSVVALNAIGQLMNLRNPKGCTSFYVTANAAPRTLYGQQLAGSNYTKARVREIFKYPTSFKDATPNEVDCLIMDEAHRLFDWKGGTGLKSGFRMINQLIKAAKVSVFFIDEEQEVTTNDAATIEIIRQKAREEHARVIEGDDLELTSEFRCLGGMAYIDMVKEILGYRERSAVKKTLSQYEFRVFDTASEMREAIRKRNLECGQARMVAGYDYEWVSKSNFNGNDFDIILDGGAFKAKWNMSKGGDYSWLGDKSSVEEVGCIHTAQGLDMSYCGVIIGKDLRYENGKLVFDQTKIAKSDHSSGIRSCPDPEKAKRLIRNTYGVLLTRGIHGTYVYCEDPKLRDYIRSFID